MWRCGLVLLLMAALILSVVPGPAIAQQEAQSEPDAGASQGSEGSVWVEIIECPGCGDCEFQDDRPWVTVSSEFGIKARIHYDGWHTSFNNVVATIGIIGNAEVVYPAQGQTTIDVGMMDPGDDYVVAWTLHCTDPGDVEISVTTNYGGHDWCTVHQRYPAGLTVSVDGPCEVLTGCPPANQGTITATIENTGDVCAENVQGTISKSAPNGGTATITGPLTKLVNGTGELAPGETATLSWSFTCTGEGAVDFTVTVNGNDCCTGDELGPESDVHTVQQEEVIVDVICVRGLDSLGNPACGATCPDDPQNDKATVSTEQEFEVTVKVWNGSNVPKNINLYLADLANCNADLVSTQAWVVCPGTGFQGWVPIQEEEDNGNRKYIEINNLCGCCYALVTLIYECMGETQGCCPIKTFTAEERSPTPDKTWSNAICDEACVTQELKAHLSTDLKAYVPICGTDCWPDEEPWDWRQVDTVAVGQQWTARIAVSNPGTAAATGVTIDIMIDGDTTHAGIYNNVSLGTIPGNGTGYIWLHNIPAINELLTCTGEGLTTVGLLNISGIDENTCEPVKPANIDPVCPLLINQCPFEVEIINPVHCTDYCYCDVFAVKARVTTCGVCCENIDDLQLCLSWDGPGDVELVNAEPRVKIVGDGDLTCDPCPDMCTVYEATWNVRAVAPGDVTFYVCAASDPEWDGDLEKYHLQVPAAPVTVHVQMPPNVRMEIVSPEQLDTFVATSQEFAVTLKIENLTGRATCYDGYLQPVNGDASAENFNGMEMFPVTITSLFPVWHPGGGVELLGGPEIDWENPLVIEAGETVALTWTFHAVEAGAVFIDFIGTAETYECCPPQDFTAVPLMLWVYSAAHLEVNVLGIRDAEGNPIDNGTVNVFDSFQVEFTVTNTGEADATEVKAIMSVTPEGSAAPECGDNCYTKYIGTLPGHGQNGTYSGIWNMQCEAGGKSTINITATGNDEYGWHKKQVCQSTGNFIIEDGAFSTKENMTMGILIGETSGLIGPFHLNSPMTVAGMAGDLSLMGAVFQNLPRSHWETLEWLVDSGYFAPDLLDILEHIKLEGVDKDVMVFFGSMSDPMGYPLYPGNMCFGVSGGLLSVINGNVQGVELISPEHSGFLVKNLGGGTYCSTMAQEALRPINPLFIEDDCYTVWQTLPVDLAVTKSVDDTRPLAGSEVTFTIDVTNNGPATATGVEVTDMLSPSLTLSEAKASLGSYDSGTGVWKIGQIPAGATATLKITAVVNSEYEILNVAELTGVDQKDYNSFNNDSYVVLNAETVYTHAVKLTSGWNLISLPLIPYDLGAMTYDPDIEDVLAGIYYNVSETKGVWSYNPADGWKSAIPDGGGVWAGTLTEVKDGLGYWIVMDAADTLDVEGIEIELPPMTPPTYNVSEGWNLIGFKSVTPRKAMDYLAGINGKYVMIYRYTNGVYSAVQPSDTMKPGEGYWIAITAPGTIYP